VNVIQRRKYLIKKYLWLGKNGNIREWYIFSSGGTPKTRIFQNYSYICSRNGSVVQLDRISDFGSENHLIYSLLCFYDISIFSSKYILFGASIGRVKNSWGEAVFLNSIVKLVGSVLIVPFGDFVISGTILKHIQRVRKVINLAVKLEWVDKDPFAKYKCNFTPSNRKYLSDEELAAFEGIKNLNGRLEYVRDLFVFSCYSGLVYIDTMQLTPKHIVLGIDGSKWIYTERRKTTKSESVRIPLLPKAEAIINKYRKDPRSVHAGTLFPSISNKRLNSYLKELAALGSIKSHLTFHVARHTFATTVALMNGLPIETLSKILGHSKITTTQMYAKVLNQKVSTDMGNLRMVIKAKEEEKKKKEAEKKAKDNPDSKAG